MTPRKCSLYMTLSLIVVAMAIFVVSVYRVRSHLRELGQLRGQPVLQVKRTEWDFGTLDRAAVLQAQFPVSNRGTRRLVINRLGSSCSCTGLDNETLIVPPRTTATLRASLDSAQFSGPVRIELHYATSDPRRPRLTLALLADRQSTGALPASQQIAHE
jgi:hypothetical protein